jgi:hypothetical protein
MQINLWSQSLKGYMTVEFCSEEHKELVKKGYRYAGLSHVAKWTESLEAQKINEDFEKTIFSEILVQEN